MKTFYALLGNSLAAGLINTFVWFAVTFWVYLETRSVIATSVMAGVYLGTVALSGVFLGSLVDRYHKKRVLLLSSAASLGLFALAGLVYVLAPAGAFSDAASPLLWAFVVLALFGSIAGNLRGIALATLVTVLIEEGKRGQANGMVGAGNGVAFLAASVFSGAAIGFLGMGWVLAIAVAATVLILLHAATLPIPGAAAPLAGAPPAEPHRLDLRGTIAAIQAVPGLFALIFFQTFNNFLGGVFMSLLDPYGLMIVSVQAWGALWGLLSTGFIVGGLVVSRRGLGRNPLRTMFLANIAIWIVTMFFTVHPSVLLLTAGMFLYLCIVPAIEASEHTILQKLVAPERQGRVFGFAQSVEQAASPVTAFVIGPIAQLLFIPFMTSGAGVQLLGPWFGVGEDRGLALLFSVTGVIGLAVTLLAMRSRSYGLLSRHYARPAGGVGAVAAVETAAAD